MADEIILTNKTESKDVTTTTVVDCVRVTKETATVDLVTTVSINMVINGVTTVETTTKQNVITLQGEQFQYFLQQCGIDFSKVETFIRAMMQQG
jgi:hypothetical protein